MTLLASLREAHAAAAIDHDHVVSIHAVDEINGLPANRIEEFLLVASVSGFELLNQRESLGPVPGRNGIGPARKVKKLCAVQRRASSAGANPARQLSFQPVAVGATMEVTKSLKPSTQRVASGG